MDLESIHEEIVNSKGKDSEFIVISRIIVKIKLIRLNIMDLSGAWVAKIFNQEFCLSLLAN